ncbi:MAG: hypothetical protein ISR48_05685 [Alphaproteobacteria bacterium]|nr:hypothetical protein [Alphaproteobacteria bacterium]
MPKTDVKKIESEDVAELTDEALDRTADAQLCGGSVLCYHSMGPTE